MRSGIFIARVIVHGREEKQVRQRPSNKLHAGCLSGASNIFFLSLFFGNRIFCSRMDVAAALFTRVDEKREGLFLWSGGPPDNIHNTSSSNSSLPVYHLDAPLCGNPVGNVTRPCYLPLIVSLLWRRHSGTFLRHQKVSTALCSPRRG